jgi:hypothetical protein
MQDARKGRIGKKLNDLRLQAMITKRNPAKFGALNDLPVLAGKK